MEDIIENWKDEVCKYKTTIRYFKEPGKIFAQIKRVVTYSEGDHIREVDIQNEEMARELFLSLQKQFNPWNTMDKVPTNGDFCAIKRNGNVYNELVYKAGPNWYLWTGVKLTRLFVKQIHHWKYASEL